MIKSAFDLESQVRIPAKSDLEKVRSADFWGYQLTRKFLTTFCLENLNWDSYEQFYESESINQT